MFVKLSFSQRGIFRMNVFDLPIYETAFFSDVIYGEADGKPLLLDICVPVNSDKPLAVIMYIHGGGWRFGDKASSGGVNNRKFTKYGFVTCSINHRLTTEDPFPAQIHDVKSAVRWLRANALKYNINPDKIGVWGHSSGGHLSALLGLSYNIPELEGDCGSPGYSSRVQAVCTSAAPTDILQMGGWHNAPGSPEAHLVGSTFHYDRQDLTNKINPINYIREDAPPFLIIHGDQDVIVPINQSNLLFDALENVSYLRVKNGDHDDYNGGSLTLDEIMPSILAFFVKHLKENPILEEDIMKKRDAMLQGVNFYKQKLDEFNKNK
jgi:acetyl esterase/lipase